MSAIEALYTSAARYYKVGKTFQISHLNADYRQLIRNAEQVIDVSVIEDPSYKVMTVVL